MIDGGTDGGMVDAGAVNTGGESVCYASCDPGDDPNTCEPIKRGCVRTCDASNPCDEGHPCMPYDGMTVCSFSCDSTACAPRRECRGFECEAVDCGWIVACANTGDICDPIAHACYPFDGSCSTVADCPVYDGYFATTATLSCTGGFCSIQAQMPAPPPGLPVVDQISVSAPKFGESITDDASARFQWSSPYSETSSTIVLVLDGFPAVDTDLEDRAVWGAALPPGQTGPLGIADGQIVQSGLWTARPGSLPHDRLLTLVIESVGQGTLHAISNVIPFSIGPALPMRGQPCNPANGAADCANPIEVLSCHPVTFACERVCASYRDCLDLTPAKDCGAPRDLTRYCE
jgi:hypothetical protein